MPAGCTHARTQARTNAYAQNKHSSPLVRAPLLQLGENGLIRRVASREGGIITGQPHMLHDNVAYGEEVTSCDKKRNTVYKKATVDCVREYQS